MTDGTETRGYYYSDDDLIHKLREAHGRVRGNLTITDYNDMDDMPTSSVVIDRFGSWVEAKKEANIGGDGRRTNSGRPRIYDDEEMLDMLRQCKERHGELSQSKIDAEDDFCSSGAIIKRFGSWTAAKEEAGLE